jgi:hypothetical protein
MKEVPITMILLFGCFGVMTLLRRMWFKLHGLWLSSLISLILVVSGMIFVRYVTYINWSWIILTPILYLGQLLAGFIGNFFNIGPYQLLEEPKGHIIIYVCAFIVNTFLIYIIWIAIGFVRKLKR